MKKKIENVFNDLIRQQRALSLAERFKHYSDDDFKQYVRKLTEDSIDAIVQIRLADPLYQGQSELAIRNELLVYYEEFEWSSLRLTYSIMHTIIDYDHYVDELELTKQSLCDLVDLPKDTPIEELIKHSTGIINT